MNQLVHCHRLGWGVTIFKNEVSRIVLEQYSCMRSLSFPFTYSSKCGCVDMHSKTQNLNPKVCLITKILIERSYLQWYIFTSQCFYFRNHDQSSLWQWFSCTRMPINVCPRESLLPINIFVLDHLNIIIAYKLNMYNGNVWNFAFECSTCFIASPLFTWQMSNDCFTTFTSTKFSSSLLC